MFLNMSTAQTPLLMPTAMFFFGGGGVHSCFPKRVFTFVKASRSLNFSTIC